MKFSDLDLNPAITRAVKERGYSAPTPVQAKTIPVVLKGKDLMASARTGTGKTAAFVLPLLQRLSASGSGTAPGPRVVIVTPTRELAAQIQSNIAAYGRYLEALLKRRG